MYHICTYVVYILCSHMEKLLCGVEWGKKIEAKNAIWIINTNIRGRKGWNYLHIKMSKKEAHSAQLQSDHGPKINQTFNCNQACWMTYKSIRNIKSVIFFLCAYYTLFLL